MAPFTRGLVAAALASLLGAGHGRGCRGSAGCQQEAQDAFGIDAQLIQITAGANSSRSVQFTLQLEVRKSWGARLTFAGQMSIANGIMSELQSEAEAHIAQWSQTQFGSVVVQGGVATTMPAPDTGTTRVFVLLPVSGVASTLTVAFNGGLEEDLLAAFRTENWGNAFLYKLSLAEGDTISTAVNSDQAVTGRGDPHLVNIRGQRFDLYQPGIHVLLQVPRRAKPQDTLLRVEADARRMGAACADLYFQALNITGSWSNRTGGLQYLADAEPESRDWRRFGTVDLKVVRGRTLSGIAYLNVLVKHLGSLAYPIGGLLGEDDHTAAATAGPECSTGLDLYSRSPAMSSFAIIEG